MKSTRLPIWIALFGVLLAALACDITPQAPAFPIPQTATPGQPSRPKTILPTVAPDVGVTASPTAQSAAPTVIPPPATQPARVQPSGTALAPATAVSRPTIIPPAASPRPTATTPPTAPPPTPDPRLVIIGEADISQAIVGGAGEEQGLKARGLQVRFRDGKMTVSADELGLGPVQIKQLVMAGWLMAQGGQLYFEPETISPRGLVASLLPGLTNQALARYTAAWYIEDVQTRDGQLILRIR